MTDSELHAQRQARANAAADEIVRSTNRELAQTVKGGRTTFGTLCKDLWGGFIRMGMYSQDPAISRPATILTLRKTYEDQQQRHAAERAEDQATRKQEMHELARSIAEEIRDVAREERTTR